MRWCQVSGSFGLEYQGAKLERYLGNHPVFHDGPKVSASDSLWSEFQACMKMGIDPDSYFNKDKFSRMLITGGSVADGMINSMRSYDIAKERELEAERNKGKRK